ncbi:formamidopyrimidine-DNA glycosylase [Liquorilactobacillus sucicola DSM 21376 = JCM 15457]|uniref:Formamidopyrimidine-DNA glycosylase n=1 Tax=Liquorilactobacillus sucicola DSM 21376 = JCM 15457 TaxID=1423806 RepID=A0A023CUP0_9LACO|nr:DNA-formamidopyrimidine glycosylase [Liquorilactobacillus sucicola]KRN05167.1 formamidopyrimidine-DNA glycosylase [Liquorilactobacillus sucicola DSM 21376 = JCM 15457]GAJ25220.1 formamidopyrimidine-DNA glycosylase [Liquorilactobacillus sucicola DSM 21376 = JCM 15457]
MPELPEVETVRRGLEKMILGAKIEHVKVLYPKIINGDPSDFCRLLQEREILSLDRRGKYLIFNFSGDLSMISHLRMEGKYFVKKSSDPLEKHTHIVFFLHNGRQLRYNDVRKFGRMELVPTVQRYEVAGIKKLGPEPTAALFDATSFFANLRKKKKVIKTTLLDQTLVAGLGNIYADEVLWLSRIHPETPACNLTEDDAKLLHDNIIAELAKAIKAGGTTIKTYTDAFQHSGSFQFDLHVYGKKGKPCERCGTSIEKIVVGQRGTHFCPSCQKVK